MIVERGERKRENFFSLYFGGKKGKTRLERIRMAPEIN